MGMCMDTRMGMRMGTCRGMYMGMCMGVCMGVCMGMCMGVCMGLGRGPSICSIGTQDSTALELGTDEASIARIVPAEGGHRNVSKFRN